jgi:hypothetical protein
VSAILPGNELQGLPPNPIDSFLNSFLWMSLRFGRLLPEVVRFSLDSLVKQHDNASLVDDIRKEMADALSNIRKTRVP